MSNSNAPECAHDLQLENFAADLADVAYRVALQHGVGQKWIDLQVNLWGAMTQAIEQRSGLHRMNPT